MNIIVGSNVRYQHKKSGGVYIVLAEGRNEADLTEVVIYKNVHSGAVWVRPRSEFVDGRFQLMSFG